MQYIDIHTHSPLFKAYTSINNIRITQLLNQVPSNKNISVGIHPWDIELIDTNTLEILSRYAIKDNVLAIGECGLDRLKGIDIQAQKEIFIYQAKLASKVKKTLIIHCVKAYPEILEIYKKLKPNNPWVLHGFNQNKQIANELIKQGIYISFGPALLNNTSNASKIFSEIAKEYIFVETDDSNIDIKEIYTKASKLRNISLIEFSKIINNNYNRCFKNG